MIRMRAEFFNLSEGQINHMLIFRDAPEASLPHAAFYEVWRISAQHPILSSLSFNGISLTVQEDFDILKCSTDFHIR